MFDTNTTTDDMYYNVATENVATAVRKMYRNGSVGDVRRMTVEYESDKLDAPQTVDVVISKEKNSGLVRSVLDKVPGLGGLPKATVKLAARNADTGEHSMLEMPHPDYDTTDFDMKDWVGTVLIPVAHGKNRLTRGQVKEAKGMFRQ